MERRVILLQASAPAKPAFGQPCNGCGVCCTAEPCPVGVLLSRRVRGSCVALTWHPGQQTYRCGVVAMGSKSLPSWAAALLERLSLRWIAAGKGCDCSLQARSA
jgi:hypothetical protein